MTKPSMPLYGNPIRVTADVAINAAPGTLWAVQLEGGTAASSMDFHDDIDSAGGTAIYGVTAPFTHSTSSSQSTVFIDLTNMGGLRFATGCYVNIEGTGAIGYVWFAKG
jgi:hypothetical protein